MAQLTGGRRDDAGHQVQASFPASVARPVPRASESAAEIGAAHETRIGADAAGVPAPPFTKSLAIQPDPPMQAQGRRWHAGHVQRKMAQLWQPLRCGESGLRGYRASGRKRAHDCPAVEVSARGPGRT